MKSALTFNGGNERWGGGEADLRRVRVADGRADASHASHASGASADRSRDERDERGRARRGLGESAAPLKVSVPDTLNLVQTGRAPLPRAVRIGRTSLSPVPRPDSGWCVRHTSGSLGDVLKSKKRFRKRGLHRGPEAHVPHAVPCDAPRGVRGVWRGGAAARRRGRAGADALRVPGRSGLPCRAPVRGRGGAGARQASRCPRSVPTRRTRCAAPSACASPVLYRGRDAST